MDDRLAPERAAVVDVEDPEGLGRVRVCLPRRGRAATQVRAEVRVPLGVGVWQRPAVGESVLVGFEGRGAGDPVALGHLGPPAETPHELRLTHAGHSVVIGDDGITLRLADGSTELVLTTAGVRLRADATLVQGPQTVVIDG